MIKLPNLTMRGSYNVPAKNMLSPGMGMHGGNQSTRFGGTPVKLVNDAKRDLNAPVIANANGALKNFTALELSRHIDKRLTKHHHLMKPL